MLVAACGGSSDPGDNHAPLDAAPLRGSASTDGVTADQLMNAAENAYHQYFPSHAETHFEAPFLYRYYPETNAYLGVVVDGDPRYSNSFILNGVYVMGGPFGPVGVVRYQGQSDSLMPS